MNGFTDTGDDITTMNLKLKTFDVYSKSFPAGCVNLGANKASGFTGGSINNYMVFYGTSVSISNPAVTITSPSTTETYSTNLNAIDISGTATSNIGIVNVTWTNNQAAAA